MSQTIDVTGLPPDAVRRLQSLVDALRKQFDPAAGAEPPATEAPPSQLPPEEWVKWFRAWAESHPKRDIEIDDDRGSIYDRSCE